MSASTPGRRTGTKARLITRTLAKHNLKIVALFGYYNVVDPDLARRKRGEQRMQVLIENWKQFNCPVISTETGTLNEKSEWLESPENATEQGYQACRAALEKLAQAAKQHGAIISIEAYWRNVIDSIARADRVLHDVPGLKLVMDPCNYYRKEQLSQMDPMLEEMFRRLGKKIVLAHAKDVKAAADGTDLPASGQGVLDYPLFLRLLAGLNRELFLIIEHLTLDDVPRARDYVLSQFDRSSRRHVSIWRRPRLRSRPAARAGKYPPPHKWRARLRGAAGTPPGILPGPPAA